MRNCTNCCKYAIDADMREEMIDLLGEFTDVMASLTDFSERLYDQLSSEDDTCVCEYDDDEDEENEENEEDEEDEEEAEDSDDCMPDLPAEVMEALRECAFDRGMKAIRERGEPGILVMCAENGPMMQPTARCLEYIAEHDENMEVSKLLDDMYLVYHKEGAIPRSDHDFVCGPVFVFKGKPRVDEVTPADVVRVMHELEKRKENLRCTNGETVTGYRL